MCLLFFALAAASHHKHLIEKHTLLLPAHLSSNSKWADVGLVHCLLGIAWPTVSPVVTAEPQELGAVRGVVT